MLAATLRSQTPINRTTKLKQPKRGELKKTVVKQGGMWLKWRDFT